jgi:DNA gyrase subunit A
MGRPASGVAGMKMRAGDEVIEVDIASDDADLLVVTENGWGKRTRVSEYPVKGRGTMGVKTAQLVEGKGKLAGARIVREGYQVMLISDGGTVIKMSADDIKRSGRATQGVIVMRLREGEHVSSLAPVIGSDEDDAAILGEAVLAGPDDAGPADVAGPAVDADLGVEPDLMDDDGADDDGEE